MAGKVELEKNENEMFTEEDKISILALICEEQNRIIKNNEYESDRYKNLERLKQKVRSLVKI